MTHSLLNIILFYNITPFIFNQLNGVIYLITKERRRTNDGERGVGNVRSFRKTSCPASTGIICPGIKAIGARTDKLLLSGVELKMSEAVPPFPPTLSWREQGRH